MKKSVRQKITDEGKSPLCSQLIPGRHALTVKDGAYFYYCAYIRCAHLGFGPGYSSFLKYLPTNTKVFLDVL